MYHTIKNTIANKKLKPPKGWQFSGDPSLLRLTKSDYNNYFMIVNKRVEVGLRINPSLMPDKKDNEWRLDECYKNSNFVVTLRDDMTEVECKEFAIKQARKIDRSKFRSRFIWVFIGALLGVIGSAIVTIIIK